MDLPWRRDYAAVVPPPAPSPAPPSRAARLVGIALVGAVLAAAVGVRLWSAWHARFSGEEAAFWNTAVGIARGEAFPALGHSVSGTRALHPGPLFFWIIAASQLFVTSPFVGNAAVSLFGLFGALVMARTAGSASGAGPAPSSSGDGAVRPDSPWTVGALLFLLVAVSPWWIVYSNSTWPSYVVTGTAACFVAALWRVAAYPRSRAIGPLAFILVAGFQLHLSLLHFWPLTLAVLLVTRQRRFNLRWLLAGTLLAVACYVPYVVSEARTHFANTRLLLTKSQGGPREARALLELYLYFLGFPTTDISYLWQRGFWQPFDALKFWGGAGVSQTTAFFRDVGATTFLWVVHVLGWLVSAAALIAGAARLVAGWRRGVRRPDAATTLYLVALLDIALFYVLSGKGGYAHYVGVLLPIAYVPVAALLAWVARSRAGRLAVAAYLAVFSLAGVLVMSGYYRVDSRLSAPQSDRVVGFVLAHARGPDGQVEPAALQFEFSPAWIYPYQVLARRQHHQALVLGGPARHRFVVGVRAPGAPVSNAPDRLELETIFVAGR